MPENEDDAADVDNEDVNDNDKQELTVLKHYPCSQYILPINQLIILLIF